MTSAPKQKFVPRSLQENRLEEKFMFWVGLGADRSYKAVATELNLPVSTVVNHARKANWVARLAEATAKGNQLTLDAMSETIAEVQEKHVRELVTLREAAFERLQSRLSNLDDKDVLKLYLESLKAERTARGMDQKKGRDDLVDLLAERIGQMKQDEPAKSDEPVFEFELDPELEVKDLDDESRGMIPVESSHVKEVSHEGDTLKVRFRDGSLYDYRGVTKALYDEMMAAKSIGSFLAKRIKPTHKAVRVE